MEHVTTCRLVKNHVENTYSDAAGSRVVALAGRVLKLNYLWRVSSYEVTPFGSNAVISHSQVLGSGGDLVCDFMVSVSSIYPYPGFRGVSGETLIRARYTPAVAHVGLCGAPMCAH
jgi:hypothetical protein